MQPLLPEILRPSTGTTRKLRADYETFAAAPYPAAVEEHVRDAYGIDLSARFGHLALRHPIGKASGQLSLSPAQVRADAEGGLAFVVLKTLIAENPEGASRMQAWKVPASRMVCERITSRRREEGWTISWVGRGWEKSLAEYAAFLETALEIARDRSLPIVPSVKFHLPDDPEADYDRSEYRHTLGVLHAAWKRAGQTSPLLVEKDFSPTLAGSDLAREKRTVLRWLAEVPRLARSCLPEGELALGVKVMNTLFEDEFQLRLLRELMAQRPPPAFLTLFNRLFDSERHLGDTRGIAYGGHDLSDRNLEVLERWVLENARGRRRQKSRDSEADGGDNECPEVPVSGTGNIESGKMMVEYALRGASSGQIHTYFQLPRSEYRSSLPRSRAALHEIVFHPERGLVAALDHLRLAAGIAGEIRFLDLPTLGRQLLEARHG
ncbi:MAG: hypothetical protein O7J95_06610 [Planctomycetota bacterium]|nr:hypothetical protein [Planctomycetota bacterium]